MGNNSFNQRLRDLRRKNKLTQYQLAEALGMKLNTYSHMELNGKRPKPEVLQQLSEMLGVPISEITGVEENEHGLLNNLTSSPVLSFSDYAHVAPTPPAYMRDLATSEQDILLKYRLLSYEDKAKVQKYISKTLLNSRQSEN